MKYKIEQLSDLEIVKVTILGKPPALPVRLPKFDISGNIRKPPIR